MILSNAFVSDAGHNRKHIHDTVSFPNYGENYPLKNPDNVLNTTINNADGSDVTISYRIISNTSRHNTSDTQISNAESCDANPIFRNPVRDDTTDKDDNNEDSVDTMIDAMFVPKLVHHGNARPSLLVDSDSGITDNIIRRCLDDIGINCSTLGAFANIIPINTQYNIKYVE